jgi:hypothetical protein
MTTTNPAHRRNGAGDTWTTNSTPNGTSRDDGNTWGLGAQRAH